MNKGMLLAMCVGVLMLTGCGNPNQITIDVNDYTTIKSVGYNGYGHVEVSLDYDAMFEKSLSPVKNKIAAKEIVQKYDLFTAKCDDKNLSNGDEVEIKWTVNRAVARAVDELIDIDFNTKKDLYEIENLTDPQEFDPFEYLLVKTNQTKSGEGSVECSISFIKDEVEINLPTTHNGNNGELKNGDTITITLNDFDNEWLKENVGLYINKNTCTYTIDDLVNIGDGDLLNNISTVNKEAFEIAADDWINSTLNDMQDSNSLEERTSELLNFIYYYNEDGSGTLVGIYKVNDYFAGEYYAHMALSGNFTYDKKSVYCNEKDFPTFFVEYDKEKVRQSVDGVLQGDDTQGFYVLNRLYAGKQTLEEELRYVDKLYGNQYHNKEMI